VLFRSGSRYGASDIPEEGEIADFYLEAVDRLAEQGIRRYEISNFASPGFESRHNLKYWRREPYRGFGADAHSFDGVRRWSNAKTAVEYIERFKAGLSPVDQLDNLDRHRGMEEHFFLGLRESVGIEPLADEWLRFGEPIRRLSEDGLLERKGSRLLLTSRGVMLSNVVFQEFVE